MKKKKFFAPLVGALVLGQCVINVGAKGKIKLFGGTILEADAKGNISFTGKVVCIGQGDVSCRPIECIDLYEVILN